MKGSKYQKRIKRRVQTSVLIALHPYHYFHTQTQARLVQELRDKR